MPVDTIGTIEPKNGGPFPVVRDIDVEGGFQVQPTTVARDSIVSANKKAGMLVYVTANSTYYQLANDLVTWNTTGIANSANAFNVRQYGAIGDNFTNDRAAFAAANAAAVAAGGGTVYVPPGVYVIATSLTLAAGVTLQIEQGARIKPSSGQTITVTSVEATPTQYIFDISAGGSFVVAKPGFSELSVMWFGAIGDGITDSSAAITAAITAATFSTTGTSTVFFPVGIFMTTGISLVTAGHGGVRLKGAVTPSIAGNASVSRIKLSTTSFAPAGTFTVANQSATVNTTSNQTGIIFAGSLINFSSQLGVWYEVQSVTSSTIMLTVPFYGINASGDTAISSKYLINNAATYSQIEDLWLDGGNQAGAVMQATYAGGPIEQTTVSRCFFTNALPNSGNIIQMTTQLEIDQFNFYDCYIVQDPLVFASYAYHLVINNNVNAFESSFHHCLFSGAIQPINFQGIGFAVAGQGFIGGSNNFYDCEFFNYTGPIVQVETCEEFIMQNCYTEAGSTPWLQETNIHPQLSYQTAIQLINCNMGTGGYTLDLLGKNIITVESCVIGGPMKIGNAGPHKPTLKNCNLVSLDYITNIIHLPLFDHPENVNIENCQQPTDFNGNILTNEPFYISMSQNRDKGELSLSAFGTYADGGEIFDGVSSNLVSGHYTHFSSANTTFTANDIQKVVSIYQDNVACYWQTSTITSIIDAHTVVLDPGTTVNTTAAYAAYGHNDTGVLQSAATTALATGSKIIIHPGTYLIFSANIAAAQYEFSPGAKVLISGAGGGPATANFNAEILAPSSAQIFTGHIGKNDDFIAPTYQNTLNIGGINQAIYPEWFGSDGYAVQKAVNAASLNGIPVKLAAKTYNVGAVGNPNPGVLMYANNTQLLGSAKGVPVNPSIAGAYLKTVLNYVGSGNDGIFIQADGGGYNFIWNCVLSDLTIITPKACHAALHAAVPNGCQFTNVSILGPTGGTGISTFPDRVCCLMEGGVNNQIRGMICQGNDGYSVQRGTVYYDGYMTSGSHTFTNLHGGFSGGSVGQSIAVKGAAPDAFFGPTGNTLITTITGFTNSTTVTLNDAASHTVNDVAYELGFDGRPAYALGLLIGDFAGNTSTTTDIYDSYFTTCSAAVYVRTSIANFFGCVFEQSLRGVMGGFFSGINLHSCWAEANGSDAFSDPLSAPFAYAPYEGVAYAGSGCRINILNQFVNFYDGTSAAYQCEPGCSIMLDNMRGQCSTSGPLQFFEGFIESSTSSVTVRDPYLLPGVLSETWTVGPSNQVSNLGETLNWRNVKFPSLHFKTYRFVKHNVQANQTLVEIPRDDQSTTSPYPGTTYPMPYAGYICGMSVSYLPSVGAGTWRVVCSVNSGTPYALDTGTLTHPTAAALIDRAIFNVPVGPGSNVECLLTTSSDFATGGDLIVELVVAFGDATH